MFIDYEITTKNMAIEDAEEIKEFFQAINYCIAEGFIEVEIDEDGEPRLYPAKQ